MSRLLFVLIASLIILLIDWYAFQSIKSLFLTTSGNGYRVAKYIYISFSVLVIASILIYNFGNPDGIAKHARTFLMSFIFFVLSGKGDMPSNECSTIPSIKSPRVISRYSASALSTLTSRFSIRMPV